MIERLRDATHGLLALSVVHLLVMRQVALALVLATVLTLSSCAISSRDDYGPDETYKVTLYSGGEVVDEWTGVTSYTRWSQDFIELRVDGESVYVSGGPLTIERN